MANLFVSGCDKFSLTRLQYLYDVWGASANLASRMESTGVDRKVQVSESVYLRCKGCNEFRFVERGLVYCKGIGDVRSYFVEYADRPPSLPNVELPLDNDGHKTKRQDL